MASDQPWSRHRRAISAIASSCSWVWTQRPVKAGADVLGEALGERHDGNMTSVGVEGGEEGRDRGRGTIRRVGVEQGLDLRPVELRIRKVEPVVGAAGLLLDQGLDLEVMPGPRPPAAGEATSEERPGHGPGRSSPDTPACRQERADDGPEGAVERVGPLGRAKCPG